MKDGPDISQIASMIGDPARANMLTALMSGKALTATELAQEAGVTLPTASGHLSKLDRSGLVRPRKQGRHKYFALAGEDVAEVLEGLMGLAAGRGHLRTRTGPKDAALRHARVCYNHLAGEMGIAMFDAMTSKGYLRDTAETLELTPSGADFASAFGIDLSADGSGKAPLCRPCLDWSERRSHLAGRLGRAFLRRFEELGWARRDPSSRAVLFSSAGSASFSQLFELSERFA